MDRIGAVILVAILSFALGGGSVYGYFYYTSTNAWKTALGEADKISKAALAEERKLVAARTQRQREAKALEEAVNADATDDCPVPESEQRMLDVSAEATRAD